MINAVWISISDPVEFFSKSSPIRIRFWSAESGWIAIRRPNHVHHWCRLPLRITNWRFLTRDCILYMQQSWDRIRLTGVDSGRIISSSFGPGVKYLWKTVPGSESRFHFSSSRNLCGYFLSKNMGKFRLDQWLQPESEQGSDSQNWRIAGPGSELKNFGTGP